MYVHYLLKYWYMSSKAATDRTYYNSFNYGTYVLENVTQCDVV